MRPLSEDQRDVLARLRSAVGHLADPAAAQIAYLTELGVAPLADELALELDDLLGAALADPNLLEIPQREALTRLDETLKYMSGAEHADLWTTTALEGAAERRQLRDVARSALKRLCGRPAMLGSACFGSGPPCCEMCGS
jgi:hypothetical protein